MFLQRQGRAPWHWYAKDDTPEERRLIQKLDLLIVPYVVVAYWIKYIDQSNLNNAYVSGMQEDLGFHKNQLVSLQSMYTAGAVIGQLPFAFIFPMFPMNWTIPALELGWGIFTLLQYRTQTFGELMAYRFFVGIFEAAFFPGPRGRVGKKRRRILCRPNAGHVGTLTAGMIQSGATKNLQGVRGLEGWRWMFIISALMTFPVAIAGVFIWPETPARPNRLFLKESELALAVSRLQKNKVDVAERIGKTRLQFVKEIFTDWKIYALTFWTVLFWNAGSTTYGGYLLWLKSLHRFSTPKITQIGTTAPALGIFYVLFVNFSSDLIWGPSGAITFAHIWHFTAMVILAVWDVPEAAKWFAFNSAYTQVAMSSVLYGWANHILRHDSAKRSFVIVFMNLFAQSTTAWTGILVFPTVEAPRFLKGWSFCATNSLALIAFTWLIIRPLARKEERKLLAARSGEAFQSERSLDDEYASVSVTPNKP
ncbi:related to permease of the major facilitator superfamily [Rhynchosporium agropyri]|uniref:Related to permease of the major facilitator superfamily n=1 Tax=Rhynchosporium agropyri TaxID=914238 RepID=A0A1E1KB65_9HELO|nr:related to permease of the major facilitator superfamily [Rhynchosporium agropyri]